MLLFFVGELLRIIHKQILFLFMCCCFLFEDVLKIKNVIKQSYAIKTRQNLSLDNNLFSFFVLVFAMYVFDNNLTHTYIVCL